MIFINGLPADRRNIAAWRCVGIIGGGAFGTAMACVLRRSRHDIVLWAREPEVVATINNARENSAFPSGVRLDPAIVATDDLAAATVDSDFILMAVPAQHLRSVASRLRQCVTAGLPVVSCSKGIERDTCALQNPSPPCGVSRA